MEEGAGFLSITYPASTFFHWTHPPNPSLPYTLAHCNLATHYTLVRQYTSTPILPSTPVPQYPSPPVHQYHITPRP